MNKKFAYKVLVVLFLLTFSIIPSLTIFAHYQDVKKIYDTAERASKASDADSQKEIIKQGAEKLKNPKQSELLINEILSLLNPNSKLQKVLRHKNLKTFKNHNERLLEVLLKRLINLHLEPSKDSCPFTTGGFSKDLEPFITTMEQISAKIDQANIKSGPKSNLFCGGVEIYSGMLLGREGSEPQLNLLMQEDRTISRKHAIIIKEDDSSYCLYDLNSLNQIHIAADHDQFASLPQLNCLKLGDQSAFVLGKTKLTCSSQQSGSQLLGNVQVKGKKTLPLVQIKNQLVLFTSPQKTKSKPDPKSKSGTPDKSKPKDKSGSKSKSGPKDKPDDSSIFPLVSGLAINHQIPPDHRLAITKKTVESLQACKGDPWSILTPPKVYRINHPKNFPKGANSSFLLGRFDVLETMATMDYDNNWQPYSETKPRKPFFIHHATAINVGETNHADDFRDYQTKDGKLDERSYLRDMKLIFRNALTAQSLSGAAHVVWNPFGMGAFMRNLENNDPYYKIPKNRQNLKDRVVRALGDTLKDFPKLTLHYVYSPPSGSANQVSDRENELAIKNYMKRSDRAGNMIEERDIDATALAQKLADQGEKVSLLNAANRKKLGNYYYGNKAMHAIDENLVRRSKAMACMAYLLNGGQAAAFADPSPIPPTTLEERVKGFGGELVLLKFEAPKKPKSKVPESQIKWKKQLEQLASLESTFLKRNIKPDELSQIALTSDESDALTSHQAKRANDSFLQSKTDSLFDLDSIRNNPLKVQRLCNQLPKGGMLHCHLAGVNDPAFVKKLLLGHSKLISPDLMRTKNKKAKAKWDKFAKDCLTTHGKQFNSLPPQCQDEFLTFYTLENHDLKEQHDFDQFESVFPVNLFIKSIDCQSSPLTADNCSILNFAQRAKGQNLSYVEMSLTDQNAHFITKIIKAADDAQKKFGVMVRFNLAMVRKNNGNFDRSILDGHQPHFVGVDLVGNEGAGHHLGHAHTHAHESDALADNTQNEYRLMRANDYNSTMHAGELGNPMNPRAALVMGVKRIGHGVALRKDPLALEFAVQRKPPLPIEINLSSNILLKADGLPAGAQGIKEHPFLHFLRSGLPVSFSTDDEGVFQTDIGKECELAVTNTNITYDELRRMSFNSVETSFANDQHKTELKTLLLQKFKKFEEDVAPAIFQ